MPNPVVTTGSLILSTVMGALLTLATEVDNDYINCDYSVMKDSLHFPSRYLAERGSIGEHTRRPAPYLKSLAFYRYDGYDFRRLIR